jgi:DNA-binding protein HU-beta
MNKAELVSAMAKEAGITKGQAEKALNCMQTSVVDAIRKGDKVTLVGFGTFSSVQRRARTGRNPQTGSEIKIPAKRVPKFAPGIQLREAATKGRARKKC